MSGSLPIAKFFGIAVKIHWTFIFIILYVVGLQIYRGASAAQTLWAIALVLAVFACVVLHEFGHALTAKRFGIKTRDITLLPIGGVASLEKMPEDPVQELLVAAAGPAVNVAIAAALTPIAILTTSTQQLENLQQQNAGAIAISAATFIPALISVNIVLVLFNMIPAFPMDGGRALRAVIAMGTDRVTATEIAARLGQAFAVLLGILGLWVNFILVIIAVFVFLGAAGEAHQTKVRALMRGVRARDAMITRFETLSPDSRIEDAYNTLITTDQANFPVTDEHGNVAGVLTRDDIARAANDNAPDSTAAHYMSDPPGEAHPADDLSSVFQNMQQRNAPLMPVTEDGRVVGIITPDHLGKWMMLNATKRKS